MRAQVTRGPRRPRRPSRPRKLVIAYEPIWAIGTGHTPTPEAANDVCRMIRATVGAMYGPPAAMALRVLYGGSVKPENARHVLRRARHRRRARRRRGAQGRLFADIVHAARP